MLSRTGIEQGGVPPFFLEPNTNNNILQEPRYPKTREEWRLLPLRIVKYQDGFVKGSRLLIGGWSVMEELERPVQRTTVDQVFEGIYGPAKVLIRGEGFGYATLAVIDKLKERGGGSLHIIELHPKVLEYAKDRLRRFMKDMPAEQKANTRVEWHEGDALKLTRIMDNDFDVVISDTFPLSPDEKDVNDLIDTEEIVQHLKPSGVFSPFIGHSEGPSAKQLGYIARHFRAYSVTSVPVRPPKDCPYFQGTEMAIMVCRGPRHGNGANGSNG